MPLVILGIIVFVGALLLIFSNVSAKRKSGGGGFSPFDRGPNGKIIYLFGNKEDGERLKGPKD
ncbi:MAG: hypothetical protein LBR44_07055 [Clostridiales Family XIII bacterium]|jgi:hypothetical protein|nr:hypothetical protein [Clostridiales Family XIII bacterium]